MFGQDTEEYIISNIESLRLNGIPHQIFSGSEANQRYPRQLKIPSMHKCIYEEMGGILYAKKSLLTFQVYYTYVMLVVHISHCTQCLFWYTKVYGAHLYVYQL